jgi:hypothetical protein
MDESNVFKIVMLLFMSYTNITPCSAANLERNGKNYISNG